MLGLEWQDVVVLIGLAGSAAWYLRQEMRERFSQDSVRLDRIFDRMEGRVEYLERRVADLEEENIRLRRVEAEVIELRKEIQRLREKPSFMKR